ncbi:YciI family protein [Fictibacillus sp. FJAT-27399]|uniref:YciI family protein n=1 Tax=Fictibacillus sp. FJAT-27399 TaxID=1729689 RepID=UPI000782D2A6|nr:YciI family protein [Fictibacillus sp. FJAT-27399]
MKYMLIVKATACSEAGIHPNEEYAGKMLAFERSLAKSGKLWAAEELFPSSEGMKMVYSSQRNGPGITAGPFQSFEHHIARYYVVEVKSEEEAVYWAHQLPVDHSMGPNEIEIRRLKENEVCLKGKSNRVMERELKDYLRIL